VWTERNAAFDAGTIDVRVNAYVQHFVVCVAWRY
jgi:hypothetical protein